MSEVDFTEMIPEKDKLFKTEDKKKSTAKRGPGRPPGSGVKQAEVKLRQGLENLFSGLALAFAATGDSVSAHIVVERSGKVVDAWVNLASHNPTVRKMLEGLTSGSVYSDVVISTGSLVIPILANKNMLPAAITNIVGGGPSADSPDIGTDG